MILKNESDELLMAIYQDGNEEAFAVLYSRHSSKIYGFLYRKIRDREKVAEIYQEVFLKIHRSKHLYDRKFPVLPWIFTITKNVLIDEIRKNKETGIISDYQLEDLPAEEPAVRNTGPVADLFEKLPDTQKSALELRYVNENTFKEIAERLKVSEVNARKLISRGLKNLKLLVEKGGKP